MSAVAASRGSRSRLTNEVLRSAARPRSRAGSVQNLLLSALPAADYERIRPDLRTVQTKVRQVIYKPGEPIRAVYFPNGGVGSVTAVMNDGEMVEVATVGYEGMFGVSVMFGSDANVGETLIQVGDSTAEMMDVEAFRRELDRRGAFYEVTSRYAHALMSAMMQSIACNTLHHLPERCCRWLLMTHDRIRSDEFYLSHEFLAIMLGVSRPTVSIVAGTLQKAGLIRYKHGHITVMDRDGLEAASCECYRAIRKQFEWLGSERRVD